MLTSYKFKSKLICSMRAQSLFNEHDYDFKKACY